MVVSNIFQANRMGRAPTLHRITWLLPFNSGKSRKTSVMVTESAERDSFSQLGYRCWWLRLDRWPLAFSSGSRTTLDQRKVSAIDHLVSAELRHIGCLWVKARSQAVAYPGILFGGGFNKFSWGQREQGSGGGSPLVRGSGGTCNFVKKFHFI